MLAMAVSAVTNTVTRGRLTPLKNPSNAHTAAPNAAPETRGIQNEVASLSTCGSKSNGARMKWPDAPIATNNGTEQSVAQSAIHTACEARLITTCALRLRNEGLHRGSDTTQHQHNGDDEPLHGADRRQRLRGDMAYEPHVGEIEYDLHRAVGHER